MQTLPPALAPLANYRQFLLYKGIYDAATGKTKKIPINPHTLQAYPKKSNWQSDPMSTADFAFCASKVGLGFGIGFLFTENDPFFFVDIDAAWDGQQWSSVAVELSNLLSGAAIEVSQSGTGLHIFGRGNPPEHANKNIALNIELYTKSRFVALTGTNAAGDANADLSAILPAVVATYFNRSARNNVSWTDYPCDQWRGPTDDDDLIIRALASKSVASSFGTRASFKDLWERNEFKLAAAFEDKSRLYDESSADAALAQHLAFWTGNDCERMLRLMWRSGLVRQKWEDREDDYLKPTIERACELQTTFYAEVDSTVCDKYGAYKIEADSDAQRQFAERIRAQIVANTSEDLALALCQKSTKAKFWIENESRPAEELVAMLTPISSLSSAKNTTLEMVTGYQLMGATLQMEHFAGCVYVQESHKILTPGGAMLKSEQFNVVYGGYTFQKDDSNRKTTNKAWDAFTESQLIRFPKVDAVVFKPKMASGAIFEREGQRFVNAYVELNIPSVPGDITPFLNHLRLLLPNERDQQILLSYMAAIVQHKGIKFQWTPLIQGAPGNGKTLFTRCVKYAIGARYSFMPRADQIVSKFNAWLCNKIFIGVEDIFVPDSKSEIIEILKPMITGGDGYEIQGKGDDQVMADICCNFILNSNHRDAVKKSIDDRRFAIFYTQQQSAADIANAGMGGRYFPDLYAWLDNGGYSHIAYFLNNYQIPDELNPATFCHRAPETSSTLEAVKESLGGVEHEILEAIEAERVGFRGGWVSSMALEQLLKELRAERAIPQNRRRGVLESLGYIYHPSLKDGRATTNIALDGGKKPRLYIHINSSLVDLPAHDVVDVYVRMQGNDSAKKVDEVFANVPKSPLRN